MNRWRIPAWLEAEIIARDQRCIYCGVSFAQPAQSRGQRPSWEHIINDAAIINSDNIALCCISCNASKGAKTLRAWLQSRYCQRKAITSESIGEVARAALSAGGAG